MTRRRHIVRITSLVLLCLLIAYLASYLVLSRHGFAVSKATGCVGFYFFAPEDTNTWRLMNYGCVYFYYPLIVIDNWIGTGKPIACEPLWKLSLRLPQPPILVALWPEHDGALGLT